MPTLTATVDNTRAYVLVRADWTDVPAVTHARVWRVNTVTGQEDLLRPYIAFNASGDLLLNCGIGVWWDTEPPLNQAVTYRTEAADVLTNTTVNFSFETGAAPWTAGGGAALAQSATFAHAGVFSGRITPFGSPAFDATVQQTGVVVDASKPVTFSAWVLSPQGWNAVRIGANFFNGAVQTGSAVSDIYTLTDGVWRYIEFTTTPPAGSTTLTWIGTSSGTPPATTLFYWDELQASQFQPVVTTAVAGPVTVVPTSAVYLKDPLNPCNDRPMSICMPGPQVVCNTDPGMMLAAYGPRGVYTPGGGMLAPENRPRLIPVIRPRRDESTSATVFTRRFTDRDSLLETLAPGTVLFLQVPPEYGISDRYIAVRDVPVDRVIPDHRIQHRVFTLPHDVVDRPAGPANGPCGSRIRDLCNVYANWDAIEAAGLDYEDLIEGDAG
jgi:hypothetical protein